VELLANALQCGVRRPVSTDRLSGLVVERVVGVRAGCSAHCWVLREHPLPQVFGPGVMVLVSVPDRPGVIPQVVGLVWCSVWAVVGWLFENYTVDASIFVVKLLRAHGGCLGIRSR
jgi:hypothetical protein